MLDKDVEAKLKRVREKLESSKEDVSNLKAQHKLLMQRLVDECGVNTLEEAQKRLVKLKKRKEVLEYKIEAGLVELERKYRDILNA